MLLITADKIHDGNGWMPHGTSIELSDDGTIIDIHDRPLPNTQYYKGILAPGFVNTHCHLELSHMKGVAAEGTGLIPFLKNIPQYRNTFTEEDKKSARHQAFGELLQNGVVAVGDISNTANTTDLRRLDKMHFHTFVEALGFTPSGANRALGYALQVYSTFSAQATGEKQLRQSIVPHAPYSVSSTLFGLLSGHQPNSVLSIHNQESEEENKFYLTKEGRVTELLDLMGIDHSTFVPTGKNSIESYLPWMSALHNYIFVHNTYATLQDIQFASTYAANSHWCLCPNANLYIENRLPDIEVFMSQGVNICIGTDSLASNHRLSIIAELDTIKKHYPNISWEILLKWGTINGAKALNMQDVVGSISIGKKPGIINLKNLENADDSTEVVRIV